MAVVLVRLAAKLPDSLPKLSEIGVSWPLLFAAVLLTGVTGLLCGLVPAKVAVGVALIGGNRTAWTIVIGTKGC